MANRVSLSCRKAITLSAVILTLLILSIPLVAAGPAPVQNGTTSGPRIWLQENQPLPVVHRDVATQSPVAMQGAQPLSMASGDIDADGFEDLLVGYGVSQGGVIAVHRGNIDAFAPQSDASFQAIGRGEFPAPFLLDAQTFAVPVRPDFVALGSFIGSGNLDLVVATRGGNSLYIFPGDGKGNFGDPESISLSGGVTSLAVGQFGGSHQSTLVVGISQGRSSSLLLLVASQQGISALGSYPVNGPVSNILFGHFGDSGPDVAFLAGGQIQILRSSTMQLSPVSLPVTVRAFALGSFIWDRNEGSQIAVIAPDGSIQIAVRNDFDPRVYTVEEFQAIRQARRNHLPAPDFVPVQSFAAGWKIEESFAGAAALGPNQTPLIFRTRISINGADDVMVLNAFSGQLTLVSHGDGQPGAQTFQSGQVSLRPYTGAPIAAVPMRINVDGRPGVMAIHQGEIAPSMLMPIPDPTFFVNKDTDPTPTSPIAQACKNTSFTDLSSSCSLREAVLKANGDTIMLQAGHTYSLTIGKVTNNFSGNFGALYVNNTATIVGGNQNTTVIQWGTPTSGTVDMVMAVNEDINPVTNASASLSNLTIQGGINHGTHGNDGDGGCMEYDTGTNGTATLNLTNVTIQNCATTFGNGGGIVIFNFIKPTGGGFPTITSSIIQNNTAVDGTTNVAAAGGGIGIAALGQLVMSSSQVLNNKAVQSNSQHGTGGGIAIENQLANSRLTTIHSSTISGNKSAGFGGGIWDASNLTIDQGTVISGNIAGTDGTNPVAGAEGGGLYGNTLSNGCPACTDKITLTKVVITGNSATGNGGGISNGNNSAFPSSGSLTMNFSRLAGNTTSLSGTNLNNNGTTSSVTNNWWGTNFATGTINTINSGATTFDPFIVLTHTSSPHPIRINQSTTLTADMSKDNHGGNGAAPGLSGNLDEIVTLPITFDGAVLGSIPQAQPETLGNPVPTATATFNAGATSGLGDAVATLEKNVAGAENYAVHVNTNLIATATESGTTATITTVGAHGFTTADYVKISGMTGAGCTGYNGGPFAITSPTTTTFTYTAPAGLSACNGNASSFASIGLVVLQPPSITKSFSPGTIQTTTLNAGSFSTVTFSITNANVVPINASFTDNLPANVGVHPGSLVVAVTPSVTNTCGGSVTANAGASSISFTNNTLPVGTCTITVHVSSAVDNIYSNSVTINSTDAGNGNTSSANLNVIDPPHSNKTVGQASIPFGATTSLSIQVSNTNQNQTLSAITFTDTLPNNAPGTLVVATPSGLANNCSGTATATAGSGSVSLASSSLAPGASCTVSLNVQGTKVGAANNSVTASDTTAGSGNTSTAPLTVVKADTSTTVTSSVNPSVFGQSVTFTATVSAVAPGAGTPTGTVTFLDGGSPIGTGTLSGGIATFATSALAAGNHTITTNYGGDVNFNGSTGSLTGNPQVVNKANTATTVTSSVNPSVFGQSVTFTATVSPVAPGAGTPTGTVTFLDGGSPIGTGTLSGGVATFSTSALSVGNHTITTNYGGDGNFNGSTGSLTGNPQVVNKANTATTVTSSVNPSVFGQSVTFTATVSAVAPGSGTATGTVTFLDGGSPIGTGTLSGGVATFSTSALSVGNHTITTNYGGDGNFNGSTGSLTGNPQVVNKANTSTTVTSSVNPSVFGQSITFTATVSPVAPGAGTVTGTVTFLDGGSPIGSGILSGGIATFATSALTVGNHTITTNYGGDGNFNGSTGSLSGNPQVVNKANTTTTVTSSANPSVFGQSVTFTATVSPVAPGAGTPTGTVTFLDGGSPIGSGVLSGGVATFATSALAVGNHTITTNYGGDGNFNGSTGSLTGNPQVVNKANTTTTVTSSANPSVFGQSVTFTATVSPVAPGAGTPTGTVTFLDGGSPIGTGTLSGGIATFATSALAIGNHTITTNYGGNGNFNGSTGSLTGNPQVVNKADTVTTVTSSVNPSLFGQSVTFTATVSAVPPGSGTPIGTVTFLDGGSPIGSGTLIGGVATFTTSALSVGNHTITTNYGGDPNFNGSTGSLTGNPQVVNKADTSQTVTSSQNPQTAGLPVTFTATVSAVAPGAGTPTGTVTFLSGGNPIPSCSGQGTLSGGVATCTTSSLSGGSHTITTSYGGDGNFNGSTGSLTGNPQVITQATTTTTVVASQGTITLGDTVTFTATVTASAGTAPGIVTFFDGNTPIGSGVLAVVGPNDQATITTALLSAAGSPHSITATYQGATAFAVSTSTPISETVNPRTSTTGVVLNPTTVVVGQSSTATVTVNDSGSVPPGTADTFQATGAPATGRAGFTSTLFADGLVLVAGGTDASNNVLNSAEIYSVSNGTFSSTGHLNTARTGAVALLLPNGKVLVAGGSSDGTANGALNTAELFDPGTGTFAVAGSGSSNHMTAARLGATVTLLSDRKTVLIAGGVNSGGVLNSAELYDSTTDTFTATGNLNAARTGASATLLGTGKVLVAGGSSDGTANGALNSAEVFDPAGNGGAGTFTSVAGSNPTLSDHRWQPEAALLLSGKVLVAGGQNSGGALTSADLYDPGADSFTASGQSMSQARANSSAVALPSGMVLLAGGTTSQAVDLYDADSDRFNTTGSLVNSDAGLVSTLLNNGQVLVVGLTTAVTPASDAELYSPSFNPLGTVAVTSSEATDNITGACALTPSTSTASTCTSTVTPVNVATSPHTITGTYPADAVHSTSSNTASLTVNKADTTTTVTSSVNPSVFGQSITFTATVSPVAPGSGTPTGTVTFLDGGSPIGTGTLSGGTATFTTSALAVGNHTITTSYGGDGNFNGSTGSLTGNPQVVNKADTTTTVTSSVSPSVFGQSVTFTATVSAVAPGSGTPTGTVTFLDGGSPIGTGTLSGGIATFTTSALAVGNHTITTSYGGDGSFNGSTGSLTGNPQVVNKADTSTTVTSSVNPSVFGQSVTFTATVSAVAPGSGTPTGTVTFLDGGSPIGTGTLSGGIATFTTSALAVGNHTITTSYGGDGNFNGSTGSLTGNPQVVNKADTSTTVTSSVNPSVFGQSVTFTATVSAVAPGSGTPTGTVTFLDGGSPIGTGTLSGGIATFTTSALAVGNHTITTSYGGDGNFNGSTGSLTGNPQVVSKANTTTTLISSLNPSALGQSVTFTATVSVVAPGSGTPTGTVTFLDGGNPIGTGTLSGGVATFTTSSLAAGNHTITASYGGDGNFNGSTGSLTGNPQVVIAPPVIAKAFNPSGIPVNGTSALTFTITNPAANTVAEAGVAFTDNLPSGVVIATPNGLSNTCGGTPTATAGSGTISLTGGTIAVNSSCTVTVNVTSSQAGIYPNTSGNVSSTNGGTGNTASATLTVAAPPTIVKSFGQTSVAQNSTVAVSFTISNSNSTVTLTGISFTDNLPAGLVVATPNQASSTCGGTVTAVAGSSSISFTGGSLAPQGPPPMIAKRQLVPKGPTIASGTCVVTVNLLVTGTGTLSNTTGPVSANESGPGTVSNTATLEVVQAPTVNKAFGAASIPLNGTTSLTFNIANPNSSTALVNISLNDTLPAGLVVANPNGLTGSCVASSTITANAGSSSISLTNLNLPAAGSCSFSVNVTGTAAGTKNNVSGNISATFDDGSATFVPITGGTASASIFVVAPPVIGKVFVPAAIVPNGVSALTFTITNPAANTVAETGVAFTDTLPANVVIATPNGLSGSCGGTVTATAGSGSISLSGGSIAVGSSCTFSVNVTSSVIGNFTNTTGAVSSTNGGTGNTASANLTVAHANLSITKSHSGNFLRNSTGNNYTITVSNSASAGPTVGTVTVTDTLPNVPNTLVPTALSGTGWTCNLGTLTCTRSDALLPGASYPAITLTVTVPLNIQANVTNSATVSGGGDPNSHTANDPTHVGPPIQITLNISSVIVNPGGTQFFTADVQSSSGEGTINFACTGLPVASTCSFNPPSTNQLDTTVTIGITTSQGNSGSVLPFGPKTSPPLYAALLSLLGVIATVFGLRNSKRTRLRLAMVLASMTVLVLLVGCGGGRFVPGTPAGTFQVTVTATSATTGDSGSAVITVQVP
ncbi:MAG TPA: Ig-like domain repeat protein [Candidatus Angelobacter sp.]